MQTRQEQGRTQLEERRSQQEQTQRVLQGLGQTLLVQVQRNPQVQQELVHLLAQRQTMCACVVTRHRDEVIGSCCDLCSGCDFF